MGTHALIDWIARGYHRGENRLARRLLRRVPTGALVLLDRNFHAFDLWHVARTRGFELLIRVQNGAAFPVHEPLPDGSYRSWVRPGRGAATGVTPVPVRVIRYQWTDRAGAVHESRLLTSLLNPDPDPAEQVVRLYHARWEQELALSEVKAQLSGRVTQVRACDPVRALAELDGLLLGHWVTREVIVQAARAAGVPPVSVSFVGAVRVLRARLMGARASRAWGRWWSSVLAEVGAERVRARRNRRYPRVCKTTRSSWPVKKPHHRQETIPALRVARTHRD